MIRTALIALTLVLPLVGFAGVAEDFEAGSGGLRLDQLEQTVRLFIYALMCLLVAWVLYSTLKDLIDADAEVFPEITARIARSLVLCVVVILTIT